MTVAGLDQSWFWPLIILIGSACTFYTVIGGIRGVIVTDALQFAVILFGVLFVIDYILFNIDQSPADMIQGWRERDQWNFLDFRVDATLTFTVWTLGIGATVSGLSSYLGDQMSLQRYLAAGSQKAASRSFTFNVIGAFCMVTLLAITGMLLSAWYAQFPDSALPVTGDKVFPYFVATVLPSGLTGLIIAAVLAATMSSLTSGVNALAGCLTNDFIRPTGWIEEGKPLLLCGRIMTVFIGIAATVGAGFVSNIGTIFDIAQTVYGVFMGPLLACMVLALLPLPVRTWSLIAGPLLGCVVGAVVAFSPVASVWTSSYSFSASMLLPLFSILLCRNGDSAGRRI
jgi:Na+/proline symporter